MRRRTPAENPVGFSSVRTRTNICETPHYGKPLPVDRNFEEGSINLKSIELQNYKQMKTIFTITFFSIVFFAKAQRIEKIIEQTEEYLAVYGGLSPWVENYPIGDFKFTEWELENVEIENDSISGYYIISIYQDKILANIDKIANHKDFPQKGSEFFLVSPDNKLFNFTLFENTGGSYKSNISVIYYKENGIILYKEDYNEINRQHQSNFFNSDGYYSIDTIQTDSCVKYLLQGSVIGCNTSFSANNLDYQGLTAKKPKKEPNFKAFLGF
ncbi:MAG: hypothetical protein LBQ22_05785 [Bacteroidales bacterium]|jgi:hypothetical protein|nr:hypothetical protein [Bacteroidales bacterium]